MGAPLQGKLVQIVATEGDVIKKGQPLFVIEAMKMESTVNSPKDGKIHKILLKENTMVEQDDCVIVFED